MHIDVIEMGSDDITNGAVNISKTKVVNPGLLNLTSKWIEKLPINMGLCVKRGNLRVYCVGKFDQAIQDRIIGRLTSYVLLSTGSSSNFAQKIM